MGLSSSSSSNSTKTYSLQQTTSTPTYTTGGSGANSPTITNTGGGGVTITDSGAIAGMENVALAGLNQGAGVAQQSLQELSDFNANEFGRRVTQAGNEDSLLASVLANNQTLATNVQSGGATVGMDLTTKVVYGAIALAALVVVFVLFKK